MSNDTLTLNLDDSLKLAGRDTADPDVRVIGALSAARILIGERGMQDAELRRIAIELIETIAAAVHP